MKRDFDLEVRKLARDLDSVRIYPIGDVHIGSAEFDVFKWTQWKRKVLSDPNGLVIMVGDILDNTLKNSKGNCYENGMNPREAKEFLYEELLPLKDRIIGAVQGNHCYRSTQLTGDCPLYDVMCRLQIEDLYRENMLFLKLNVGEKSNKKQCSYTFAVAHGVSKNKTEQFGYALDGVDCFITGHTHDPTVKFPAKIVVDSHNECVRVVGFNHIVVPSFHGLGGYALKGMYLPKSNELSPIIGLSGRDKDLSVTWTK